mgnify:CR=1 FL=1
MTRDSLAVLSADTSLKEETKGAQKLSSFAGPGIIGGQRGCLHSPRLHQKECGKQAREPRVHGLFCAVNCSRIRPFEAFRHIP